MTILITIILSLNAGVLITVIWVARKRSQEAKAPKKYSEGGVVPGAWDPEKTTFRPGERVITLVQEGDKITKFEDGIMTPILMVDPGPLKHSLQDVKDSMIFWAAPLWLEIYDHQEVRADDAVHDFKKLAEKMRDQADERLSERLHLNAERPVTPWWNGVQSLNNPGR